MSWKKVALAGCVAPTLWGCNIAQLVHHNLVNEPLVAHTEWGIERDLRSDAKASWQEVRSQFPRRMFTADFRDGFVDGYTDYLAHGGTAQPPAVPPLKYTRNKKYYSPEGHCLIRDYYLGFKYGADVAVATGQRKFMTVPVLLPEKEDGPPTFTVQPAGRGAENIPAAAAGLPVPPPASTPQPLAAPKALPAPPGGAGDPPAKPSDPPAKPPDPPAKPPDPPAKPPESTQGKPSVPWASPATKPTTPPKPADPPAVPKDTGSKFGPSSPSDGGAKADPDTRLPVPNPPLPIPLPRIPDLPGPTPLSDGPPPLRPTPPPLPKVKDGAVKPAAFTVSLPEPPSEVPTLPDHLPTPSVFDDLPVIPANHAVPPPLPANHAVPPPNPR